MCLTDYIAVVSETRQADSVSTDPRAPIHERLRAARKRAKLTQADIAAAVGYAGAPVVSKVEKGERGITVDKVELWLDACGMDLVAIAREDVDPEGLIDLVRGVRNPHAREILASLARLSSYPDRFWSHLKLDIDLEMQRAQASAVREQERDQT